MKLFFNEHMTRITDIRTESIISTFNGETAGDNADNLLFPIMMSFRNLIRLEEF